MSSNSCDETLTAIYLYLDKEMGRYRRWRVSRHLRACPPCIDIYQFEERLRLTVRNRCTDELPAELIERLRSALRRESR